MDKYITVCFHRGDGFDGARYDFALAENENVQVGDVVRLINSDKQWLYSAGRVQIKEVKNSTTCPKSILKTVYTVKSSLDENREEFLTRKDKVFTDRLGKGIR